jgi:hypothetical protein
VLQEQHARCGEFSTLEDLFEQTVSDYQKRINALTSLTEDAQAANDKSAINFLKRYRKEEIVDGTLLQIILDEVRSAKEGANKQVISSQADSLIKISRIWADFFPQTHRISLFRLFFPPFLALFPVFTEISPTDVSFGPPETGWPG